MRSTETVTTAVTTNAAASARVERRIDRAVATCTMRTAVTISTPDSAARGMWATGPATTRTTASSTAACATAATRVRAPERTLTAVRAIAPVAGMPPNRPAASEARPWPTQLAVGVVRAGVGEGGGDPGGQQRLDGRERRDGERRGQERLHRRRVELRDRRGGQGVRQRADGRERGVQGLRREGGDDDADERSGDPGTQPGEQQHAGRHDRHGGERPRERGGIGVRQRRQRGGDDVGVRSRLPARAGQGGHLLQEDDGGDAEGEALDDGPRDERHGPAQPGDSRRGRP